MYKRVLLKISGEALSSPDEILCRDHIKKTVDDIVYLHDLGIEIGIVCGGGNILRGRSNQHMERSRADHMGMLSTAINSLALQDEIEQRGVPCRVLSSVEMPVFCDRYTSRDAKRYLDSNTVVIFACGTGSPFFSTDTGASLRAAEIGADILLLAKNVDAVYSDDPKTNPDAVRYTHLSYERVIAENLHATDLTAITMCREQHIPIRVFALSEIRKILDDPSIGTTIDDL